MPERLERYPLKDKAPPVPKVKTKPKLSRFGDPEVKIKAPPLPTKRREHLPSPENFDDLSADMDLPETAFTEKPLGEEGALELEKQINALKESIGVETERAEGTELKKITEQFKADLKKGRVAYRFNTKIPMTASYRGFMEKHRDISVENYVDYFVKGEDEDALKPSRGVEIGDWKEFGDVLVILSPQERHERTIKTVTEEKKTFWGGIKKIQTEKETGKDVPLTLAFEGVKNGPDEALYYLSVKYGVDNSRFKEKRPIFNDMHFSIPEKLARGLAGEITKDPKNLWKFLKSIEPELMELTPQIALPIDPDQPKGLVFYDLKNSSPNYTGTKPTKIVPD